jgi:hypothetical protein
MKNNLKRLFTLPNIVIILSALYICFQIYELPSKVSILENRVTAVEKENITLKTKLDLCLNAIYDIRSDIKQLLKDIK